MRVHGDEIRLALPAEPLYGHIARIAITRLALQAGLTRADIEDLRIAVDETLVFLLRQTDGHSDYLADHSDVDLGEINFTFTMGAGSISIDAEMNNPSTDQDTGSDARKRFTEIVSEMVDTFSINNGGTHVHFEKACRK